MNTESVACEIVAKVLDELYDHRAGFSDWWETIDPDVQEGMENEFVDLVKSILDENT